MIPMVDVKGKKIDLSKVTMIEQRKVRQIVDGNPAKIH